jgi:hypothetical protein
MGRPGRPVGYRESEETKSRTSASMMNHYVSPRQKEKTSDSITNYWLSSKSNKHRDKLSFLNLGFKSPKFKGRSKNKDGYIMIYYAPGVHIYEHVWIAENCLGRKLQKNECVHHLDYIKDNNKKYNLLVVSKSDHGKLHNRKEFIFQGINMNNELVEYEVKTEVTLIRNLGRI